MAEFWLRNYFRFFAAFFAFLTAFLATFFVAFLAAFLAAFFFAIVLDHLGVIITSMIRPTLLRGLDLDSMMQSSMN